MKVLLDTHIWLWWLLGSERLEHLEHGLHHDRELVGSAPTLWVVRRCRHHFSLQTPVMPPVVEGGDMAAELLANLSNILSLRRAHTRFHLSFYGLVVTKH